MMDRQQRKAFTIYLVMTGLEWMIYSLVTTVLYVYLATNITTDPFRLMLISSVLTGTTLLFEIPTGVIADVYSRRLSIVIGYSLIGLAVIIVGAFQIYALILLAQVVWGLGFTFISGSREAWIADEIGQERVAQAYLRAAQISQFAILIGIGISTTLGTIALNLPLILGGLLFLVLAAGLAWLMPEEGFQPRRREALAIWQPVKSTFTDGIKLVRVRPVLSTVILISTIFGLSSAGFDNLWTVNILENLTFPAIGNFEPVVWFGMIKAVESLVGLAGMEIIRRKVDFDNQPGIIRTLMFLTGATAVCMIFFGLTGSFWLAALFYCLILGLRTTIDPVYRTWVNLNTESNVRATVLSMESQAFSLGNMIGGQAVGAIGSAVSLSAALVTTGLVRIPVTIIFAVWARLLGKEKKALLKQIS